MITIESQADLDGLRHSSLLPRPIFEAVASYFRQLTEAETGDSQGEMMLTDGRVVVIEPGDGPEELRPLLASWPEYGELLNPGRMIVLKIVVMEDNDFIVTYFVERGVHSAIDEWIEPYLETE